MNVFCKMDNFIWVQARLIYIWTFSHHYFIHLHLSLYLITYLWLWMVKIQLMFFFIPDNKLVGWWVQEWLVPLVSIVTKFYVDIENIIKYFYCKKYIFIWKFIQWYHINAQKWYCHSYFIITRVIHCQTKFHGNQYEALENFPPSLLIYIEILKL